MLTISPNPVTDVLTIQSSLAIQKINVLNTLGQEVIRLNEPLQQQGLIKLKTDQLAKGVYVLHMVVNDSIVIQRFVKN